MHRGGVLWPQLQYIRTMIDHEIGFYWLGLVFLCVKEIELVACFARIQFLLSFACFSICLGALCVHSALCVCVRLE